MTRNTLSKIVFVFILIIGIGVTGCDSNENATSEGAGGTGEGGTGGGTNTFTGILRNNLDETPIPNAPVKALDNATLEELGREATSDIEGKFTITGLPDGEMCLFAVGEMGGDYPRIDTYTYNVETNEKDRDIYSIPISVAELIDSMICGPTSIVQGGASGGVYYYNEAGDEFPVDCATVEVEEATADTIVYYFQGGLPSVGVQDEPCDRSDLGAGRILETASSGRFYANNLPEGIVHLTAKVNGQPIGSTTLKVIAPKASTGGLYNSNITRIYVEGTGDPTPDCVSE